MSKNVAALCVLSVVVCVYIIDFRGNHPSLIPFSTILLAFVYKIIRDSK